MLSERLKSKEVFSEKEHETEGTFMCLNALDTEVESLVKYMNIIERAGLLSREAIENYVLTRFEAHEKSYYGMTDEEFHVYMNIGYIQSKEK